jgi:transposase
MAESLHVDDGLWAVLEPLLPERVPRRIGRPRVDDRIAFTAILFVLVTGVPWRVLPRQLGCSGVTAWRRLRDWQAAGVWDRLHRELLRRLNALGRLDWSAGVVDGSHIRALRGGPLTGRSPVDRGPPGPSTT